MHLFFFRVTCSIISAIAVLAGCAKAALPKGFPEPTAAQLKEYATALSLHIVNEITAIVSVLYIDI